MPAATAAELHTEPKDHGLVSEPVRKSMSKGVLYEKRPVKGADGSARSWLVSEFVSGAAIAFLSSPVDPG